MKFFMITHFILLTFIMISCKDNSVEPPSAIEQWKFIGLENETVTAIAVDPIYPNIIYAGTRYDYSAGINGKLFKSTDSGTTWDTLLVGGGYRSILIDPSNHNIIYAAWGGIMKSYDGGKTWKPIINGIYISYERRVQSLAMNPKNPNVLYAGTEGVYGGTMYKSYNGGLHWNEIGSDSLSDGVVSIAIDPIDTNNVYAGTAWRGILWKSSDAGSNWFRTGLGETGIVDIVAVNPKQSNIIYAGARFEGFFTSYNLGKTWVKEGFPDSVKSWFNIQFNPTNEFDLYIASFGVFNQKCNTCLWKEFNEGIEDNLAVTVLAISKNVLYAGRTRAYGKKGGIFVRYIK
ncbi:MAG: hypothetical protein AB1432_15895 [Bacteroidota bacterium]